MDAILNRKSIRKYDSRKVSDEMVQNLLRAAMQAPSACNEQPWEFIVLRNKDIMQKIPAFHPYSTMLPQADAAIVVCGDKTREVFPGFWIQDCSAATENILIAAEDMGLGAVWLGVYPLEDRVTALQQLLALPENVIPLCIVPIGYPAENRKPADRFDTKKIHYDMW
jgi:nitroreductase